MKPSVILKSHACVCVLVCACKFCGFFFPLLFLLYPPTPHPKPPAFLGKSAVWLDIPEVFQSHQGHQDREKCQDQPESLRVTTPLRRQDHWRGLFFFHTFIYFFRKEGRQEKKVKSPTQTFRPTQLKKNKSSSFSMWRVHLRAKHSPKTEPAGPNYQRFLKNVMTNYVFAHVTTRPPPIDTPPPSPLRPAALIEKKSLAEVLPSTTLRVED